MAQNSGQRYNPQQQAQGRQENRSQPQGPAQGKINGFYANEENKTVKPDLFDKTAESIASGFVGKNNRGDVGVSRTQLRRLYDEVKRFEQNLDGRPEAWQKHYPYIKMIKSKVCYNVVRAIEKNKSETAISGAYKELSAFVTEGIDLIKTEEDYHVFAALFEAVYGFYYEKAPEKAQDYRKEL